MSPLPEHERFNRAFQLLLPALAEELGVELYHAPMCTLSPRYCITC